MNNAEELIKLKELMEQGIISEEEFQKKKIELLGIEDKKVNSSNIADGAVKGKRSKNSKIIFSTIAIVFVLIAGYFVITKLTYSLKNNAICKEAELAIADVMKSYGLNDYEVTSADSLGTSVLCPEFEDLPNAVKYSVIMATIKLRDIVVKDESIDLECNFYVNSRDYYHYVSPLWAASSKNNYTCGGIYKYDGNRYCVYEVD